MNRLTRPDAAAAGEAARLGEELRDARLALGLSVEDIAASLRIRRGYLLALEEGRLRDLPAPAYALGFVRSYARALGLDEDEMVRRFREVSGPAVQRKTDLVFPEPVPERGVPAGAVMLLGAVLAVGAYIGWYQWSGSGIRTVDAVPPLPPQLEQMADEGSAPPPPAVAEPVPPPPTVAEPVPPPPIQPTPSSAVAATVPRVVAPAPAAPEPAPAPEAPLAAAAPPRPEEGRVVLRAKAEAWVQVRERPGGPILVNRVLRPGESWTAPAKEGLLLSTGNANGLEILVDGQVVPGLGPGRAVRRDVPMEPEKLKAGLAPPAGATAPQ
ncbi:MAG: DUF4115 domain-containing protein [Acetobacteraceae bacterium]|nr:DUF4115 domain-containing protein [Acetobacteraceae bacterium]